MYNVEKEILQSLAANLLKSQATLLQSTASIAQKFWNDKVGQELLQSWAGNLPQTGSIVIAKWARYYKMGQIYCKVGQSLQRRPLHLRDTRTNGDSCLLIATPRFKIGVV